MTGLSRELVSVIYSSRAAREFTPDDLDRLLLDSRQRNETTELSGLLLYRSGTFLQLLEGPRKAVWQRFASIERDPRHTDVVVQSAEPIDQRMFGHWAMAHPGAPEGDLDEVPGYREVFDDLHRTEATTHGQWAFRELTRWFATTL
ncbi:BLUF domain-containing protein [Microbacterium arborescens]|uniref:BLUF domain-containing protein n=1 Tax=Microbacterium arborescens TaxID=33883 RepID=UPI003C7382A1